MPENEESTLRCTHKLREFRELSLAGKEIRRGRVLPFVRLPARARGAKPEDKMRRHRKAAACGKARQFPIVLLVRLSGLFCVFNGDNGYAFRQSADSVPPESAS